MASSGDRFMKCAYCQDELEVAANCVECQTAMHFECWEEHPNCPTLGCEVEVKRNSWGLASSVLGFLFLVISALVNKTDPIEGPCYWDCGFGRTHQSSLPEKLVLTKVSVDPTELFHIEAEEFQIYLDSTARVLRERLNSSPRDSIPLESLDLTVCRHRVVGRKKEEETESLPPALLMRPERDRPGDYRGGVTW